MRRWFNIAHIGLDVHKKTCHATVMDERGEVRKEGKFPNKREGFEEFFNDIDDAEVAMEASYCWQSAYEWLESEGHKVKLAHPLKTRVDRTDSRALAHLLRMDWLPTSYVPLREIRELRDLVRLRTYLVRERTRLKNKVRAELAKRWIRTRHLFTKRGRKQLRELGIQSVDECLAVMGVLDERIGELSRSVKQRADENEDAKIIMSTPDIGHFSAFAVLAEIGNVHHFPNGEKLCSYAGLVPSTYQSGNTRRYGRITKQGSGLL